MYERVEYVWDHPEPFATGTGLTFTSVDDEARRALFEQAVDAVLDGSLDSADQAALEQKERRRQAERLSRPDGGFSYRMHWWALAYDADANLIGLVQPVVFAGCDRDGLHEGTIHYIGVLPRHRGRGYVNDLLAEGTNRLARLGVWRIYTDTDVRNAPMRQAFLRLGYREGRVRSIPFHDAKP